MHEGRTLAGKYRLIRKLSAGGMGAVWVAEHVELGTPAAVKLLDHNIADTTEALSRFKREAQSAASLRSTNIVQVFDYGVDDHTPYIAMELLRGQSLAEKLGNERLIAPRETGIILHQVARAAAWAHSRDIVHRDLKPGNIFLTEDANDVIVKLLDFGIAKPMKLDLSLTPVTLTGSIMGTPQYMSPEQASGKRQVNHRTDIWSYAIIAFECLTGHHAFRAETLGGLVLAICAEPLPIPSHFGAVPAGFDDWFARAAHRNPDCRYADMGEAGDHLLAICGFEITGSARIAGVTNDQAPELRTIASPITPRLLRDGVRTDGATTTTLGEPRTAVYQKKTVIWTALFLLGVVAGVVSVTHFFSDRRTADDRRTAPSSSPLGPSATTMAIITPSATPSSSATGANSAEQTTHAATAAPAVKAPMAQATMGKPTLAPRSTRPPPIGVALVEKSLITRRPLPQVNSSAAATASNPAPPAPTICDPEVKKLLGFCPRTGK